MEVFIFIILLINAKYPKKQDTTNLRRSSRSKK